MRILLDENLNWRLKRDLPGHEVVKGSKSLLKKAVIPSEVEESVSMAATFSDRFLHFASGRISFLTESFNSAPVGMTALLKRAFFSKLLKGESLPVAFGNPGNK